MAILVRPCPPARFCTSLWTNDLYVCPYLGCNVFIPFFFFELGVAPKSYPSTIYEHGQWRRTVGYRKGQKKNDGKMEKKREMVSVTLQDRVPSSQLYYTADSLDLHHVFSLPYFQGAELDEFWAAGNEAETWGEKKKRFSSSRYKFDVKILFAIRYRLYENGWGSQSYVSPHYPLLLLFLFLLASVF